MLNLFNSCLSNFQKNVLLVTTGKKIKSSVRAYFIVIVNLHSITNRKKLMVQLFTLFPIKLKLLQTSAFF